MAITITEKQHWKERIESKINKRIDQIRLLDSKLFQHLDEQSRSAAITQANLAAEFSRLAQLDKDEAELKSNQNEILNTIHAALCGKDTSYSHYNCRGNIEEKLRRLKVTHLEELMRQHEQGREVLKLNSERDNLLDTVWLATSPKQVIALWQKVVNLLDGESTEMQKQILLEKESSD